MKNKMYLVTKSPTIPFARAVLEMKSASRKPLVKTGFPFASLHTSALVSVPCTRFKSMPNDGILRSSSAAVMLGHMT